MSLAAVFQIGSLGDTIMSIPALMSIRDLLPECSEYLLVSSRHEKQVKVTPSHVFDMVWKPRLEIRYVWAGATWRKAVSTASALAGLRYYRPRYAVSLMPVNRSHRQIERDKLFFHAAGIRELIGFRTCTEAELSSAKEANIRDTQGYLRFRRLWNEEADRKYQTYTTPPLLEPNEQAIASVDLWLMHYRVFPERTLVALCPFSNHPSRDLPDTTILGILARLDRGRLETVLVGGHKDRQRGQELLTRAGAGLNACGVMSLEESAALLKRCSVAICTESGPMHLAGALGVPCVSTFSQVNERMSRWLPLGVDHTILYQDVSCAGCRLVDCEVEGHPCMNGIEADQIVAAVDRKLNGRSLSLEMSNGTRILEWPPALKPQPC
jgi:heptosyltransferase-3